MRGEQFIAKGFTGEQGLTTTKEAQTRLGLLFSEDEQLIPKSEIFNDTLFSEKAKGSPIKELIAEAIADPTKTERAAEALYAVGATLGMLHERTERPILATTDLTEQVVNDVTTDRDKIMRHLDELSVASLVDIDAVDINGIKERVKEFTVPEYVSLIHGDAHLDQFFHEEGGATVEIVDYDDIREGDPMADLSRLISSQRDWCRTYGASRELETHLTREVAEGYTSVRKESGLLPDSEELDMMRVVTYELRLQLVKLKNFSDIRQKMTIVGAHLGLSEHEVVTSTEDQAIVIDSYLSSDDQKKLQSLRVVTSELTDILTYLRPVQGAEPAQDEHTVDLAA